MKTIALLFSIIISTALFANGKIQPIMMYRVITDTVNYDVPSGKCLITGVVTHLVNRIHKANVFSEKSNNVQTDREGRFRILVDTAETYLVIHKVNLPETYVEYYKFSNRHHIDMEIYIPEENMMIIADKPVIYLYNEESTNVTVSVNPQGDFTFTYPVISNENNWIGSLSQDGFSIENKVYPYIFYETKMSDLSFIKKGEQIKGSAVNSEDVITFLEQSLSDLNFNSQEQTDFITYWAPKMTQHDKVFIQLWNADEYEVISSINVSPTPNNLQRVFMVYASIENGINIVSTPQNFNPTKRTGFTVIEWGGSELPSQKLLSLKTL